MKDEDAADLYDALHETFTGRHTVPDPHLKVPSHFCRFPGCPKVLVLGLGQKLPDFCFEHMPSKVR